MITSRLRNRMKSVLVISLAWMLFAAFTYVSEYFFVMDLIALKKLSGKYDFWPDFVGNIILGATGGFIGGYLLVFKLNTRYNRKSFAFGIINAGVLFVIFYLTMAVVGLFTMAFIYFLFQVDIISAAGKAWNNVLVNFSAPSFFISMIAWALLFSFTQFLLQVNDKFGQGILWKFITGKYYHPREEERIFMFLDLKSSTSIAERIGNKNFFALLKETFSVITEPILNSHGEIYQYVGDEVVLSWPVEEGLKGNNCLQCFFMIEQALEKRKDHFMKEYGIRPSFKAGMHLGEATVGEIGVIKKDIVFSGDVLNTTSRIQGECNNHNVNIILSSALLERLPLKGEFRDIALGEIQLKGKKEKVALSTVSL